MNALQTLYANSWRFPHVLATKLIFLVTAARAFLVRDEIPAFAVSKQVGRGRALYFQYSPRITVLRLKTIVR